MKLLYILEGLRTPLGDVLFGAVTHLGEELVFMAVAVFVFWCVDKYRGYYLLTVGFVGTVISQFLKILCCIPRPWVIDPTFTIVESARAQATGYSFPSGHTQNAVGTFGGIARFTNRTWLRWVMILLALAVSFSRMYLGVHTPLDVGVGFISAVVLLLVLYPLVERMKGNTRLLLSLALVMLGLSAAFWAYLTIAGAPCAVEDVNYDNYLNAVENAKKMTGATLGLLPVIYFDEKYFRFDTHAVWWAQVLKLVLGLGLVVGIKSGLKPLLNAVIPDMADVVRYFVVVLTVGIVWPLSFRFWKHLGRNKE